MKMNKYIALLRGINVSGQKIIKMADLKLLFEDLKFSHIKTYIQSGNVVFCTDKSDSKVIAKLIENKIEKTYAFTVPILILKKSKLEKILLETPLDINEIDLSKLYFTFLNGIPEKSFVNDILKYNCDSETFIIKKDVIYFHTQIGAGRTKLTNNFFEKKLKVSATSRSWKTTNKLLELLNEINCGK